MKRITKSWRKTATVALALLTTLPSALGQQTIKIYVDDSDFATEQALTYEATCPSGKYKLRINQNDSRVEFEYEGAIRTETLLSDTPFGKTFLERSLHGKFYSKCKDGGAIRIVFYGIEPRDGASLKTVRYGATIGSDGAIIRYDTLDEVPAENINFWFSRKAQQ